jgi:hypothetical protein
MNQIQAFAIIAIALLISAICSIEYYFIPKYSQPHDYVDKTTIMNNQDTTITIHEVHYL